MTQRENLFRKNELILDSERITSILDKFSKSTGVDCDVNFNAEMMTLNLSIDFWKEKVKGIRILTLRC